VAVFRAQADDGKFHQRSRLLQGTTFTDTDVLMGTMYSYRLRAYDTAGNLSEFSPQVVVTTGRADR
jgi:chitodextrinase